MFGSETLLMDSKKQNELLWARVFRQEKNIANLSEENGRQEKTLAHMAEENRKLADMTARLREQLEVQAELNKDLANRNDELANRNTKLASYLRAKDTQISVLKENKKSLIEKNSNIVSYLKEMDKFIGSIQIKQEELFAQQQQLRFQHSVTDGGSTKRRRDEQKSNHGTGRNTKARGDVEEENDKLVRVVSIGSARDDKTPNARVYVIEDSATDVISTSSSKDGEDGDDTTCGDSRA
ncbi:unnamed protein product [Pseudo-nitzschia multistriata]|uniref:Uncharacterized protein n=1 Tax=Pseudo-nitzschia multistriata TaxID=183589 RepID=A0A448ZR35_9STRA|nr:unnamed protein product [Pseudo-nitzschia multistriata]